ncbi:Putative secretion protein HlyD family protein [Candidatus Phycorickettsia trachydisci]|uniref:Secretion protein HlyD family protein n=1 Tax=Candidatus Phycorickettsia trachydisci TaxID=2115978 RepID=A0A2P1P8P2_9RICK|nr:efflux RND transporter periplasmic adaptor subunit [Candidatus Phycorickettsia trachydisci]AVP87648.1 Putative secretion protein HlyD family protein [Candidatus Phycorickettsia trachydisci]
MRYHFYFLLLLLTSCNQNKVSLHGYVEGEYQYITPTTSGTLKNLYVHRGDVVKTGDKLFALDDVELKAAIENAKADIRQLEAVFDESTKTYQRSQELLKSKTISQADFDKQQANYNAAKAKLDAANQSLVSAEKKLQDSAPLAINDAYIENTFFLPGEFVQAGKPVVSLLPPNEVKVRFFVPQKQLPKIAEGKYVTVSCDGCPKKIKAKIIYIAKQAEYTPPVIYSTDARQKMVFMVEAKTDQPETSLNPGLPVDINIEDK